MTKERRGITDVKMLSIRRGDKRIVILVSTTHGPVDVEVDYDDVDDEAARMVAERIAQALGEMCA